MHLNNSLVLIYNIYKKFWTEKMWKKKVLISFTLNHFTGRVYSMALFIKIWMRYKQRQYSSIFSQRKFWSLKSIKIKVAYLHKPYLNKNSTCFREFYEISLLALLILTQSLTQKSLARIVKFKIMFKLTSFCLEKNSSVFFPTKYHTPFSKLLQAWTNVKLWESVFIVYLYEIFESVGSVF